MKTISLTEASQAFSALSPAIAMSIVEEAWELRCDGQFFGYPSYVNRVYGLRSEEAAEFVIKFYRPGRWTRETIQEEHYFLAELAAAEVPVVAPLPDQNGDSLVTLELAFHDTVIPIHCALFPKRAGRSFDADGLADMTRLGALAGRIHTVGSQKKAHQRNYIDSGIGAHKVRVLLESGAVPQDIYDRVRDSFDAAANYIDSQLREQSTTGIRLHGDFHRGNILDCGGKSLLAVDFDDMCCGPAVLDLWMLLPAYPQDCPAERDALLEGYEQFMPFDPRSFKLIPALQLLRILHYLEWQSRQRFDTGFLAHFPGWGSRNFWQQEADDLACRLGDILAAAT